MGEGTPSQRLRRGSLSHGQRARVRGNARCADHRFRLPGAPEMDGQRVKEWEARCIEEQPPACTMACPLRVDVRGMLEKMRTGDFAGACALYARVIPFPAILSRICDHPCEAACRRAESGGAISIAALERACIENAYASIRRAPQSNRKAKRVAVVGAGLAGLTAAFDLA